MDQNVLNAQKYLNAMYGGNSNWVTLSEDGNTGTSFIQGIVRAFQIENGLATPNGNLGPATLAKMKSLAPITLMNPDDPVNNNVCLIQCALFGKGYNAGGITGIYYNFGMNAVKTFQSDAGLAANGVIDWKVWQGLLSLNWFFLASGGSETLRNIQLMFNQNWSDYLGVGPCDGIMSRQTALSPLAALQAQEGLITDTITDFNSLNFGPATSAAFPGVLKINQSSGNYRKYNMIAQAALYFNGYNPGNFTGTFDTEMQAAVTNFQNFYALTGIGLVTPGEINLPTMKSLLTSKGDENRKAYGCDTATVLSASQAKTLKSLGYTHVGRYLTGTVGTNYVPKFLTFDEIQNIESAGLKVVPIYQDGGYYPDYFIGNRQGVHDAKMAILAAKTIGVPSGTTIYFAVDYDFTESEVYELIVNYFEKIRYVFNSSFNDKNYKVGIYASRQACSIMNSRLLADYSYVSDMSTGFSGNLGHQLPRNWAFDQFAEIDITATSPSFPIDKVAVSGRDDGIEAFDKVPVLSVDEQENLYQNHDQRYAQEAMLRQIMDSLWLGDQVISDDLFIPTVSGDFRNAYSRSFSIPGLKIETILECGFGATMESSGPNTIAISYTDGSLSALASNAFATLNSSITDFFANNSIELPFSYRNVFDQIASGIQNGTITPTCEFGSDNSVTLNLTAQSNYLKAEDSNLFFVIRIRVKVTVDSEQYENLLKASTWAMYLIPLTAFAPFASQVVSFNLPTIWITQIMDAVAGIVPASLN